MKKALALIMAAILFTALLPAASLADDDICPATNEPHSWYQWGTMKAPSIHETGIMRYKCRNCEATKDEEIPKRDAELRYTLYGGTNHPDNPKYISDGMRVTLKDPTREGYTFLGWYTSAAMTQRVTVVECTDDYIYLHAKWRKNGSGQINLRICPDTNVSYRFTHETRSESTAFRKYGFSCADESVATVSLTAPTVASTYNYEAGWLVSVSNYLILNFSTHTEGETLADLVYNGETVQIVRLTVGHDWGDWETVTEATETAAGLRKHTCRDCGTEKEEVIPRLAADITYVLNGGTNHTDNPALVLIGQTVTLKAPTRTGYAFVSWCADEALTQPVTTITGAEAVTVYAKWAANGYTVNFDGNGAAAGSMEPLTMAYGTAKALTANAFTRTGYSFAGWNTNKDGSGKAYADKASVKNLAVQDGAAVTLYAQWKANSYTVNFDGNGATAGSMDPLAMAYGTAKALTANAFTRTGYTFAGWNTKKDGSGTAYTDKASVKNLAAANGAAVTLYARWKANSYTVSFDGNGAKAGEMDPLAMTYGASKKLTANAFTRTGYTFAGWNTKKDGSGTAYANKASVKNLASANGADVTLYARWKANSYTVSFDGNGAKSGKMNSQAMTYGASKKLTACAFARTGYTFAGWNTKKDGSGKAYANKASVKNLASANGADVTLYAQWKANSYTVKFSGNGAASGSMKALSLKYGASKKLTASAFKRTGYRFAGWNTKKDGSGKAYANKASVKNLSSKDGATVTLYAQWKANSYSVKFNGNGATSGKMDPLTLKYGASKKLTANAFRRKGYKFVGWNTKKDGSGKAYTNKEAVKNLSSKDGATVTLYAQWKKNK